MSDLAGKRVCVTGGSGFLGQAVCRELRKHDIADLFVPRSSQYDLTTPYSTAHVFTVGRPDIVIHLAAEVGGIGANQKHPGRFFYANMLMGVHLIENARRCGVERFVQIGTVCSYPGFCPIPFVEDDLWSGYPEPTNAPYGVAKRALGVMLDAYRKEYGFNGVYLIPTNLYGPGDNFDLETSHVIPALIRKFSGSVEDSTITCWGTGKESRDFLYVDDAAEAIVEAAAIHNDSQPINLGTGQEVTIVDLAEHIAQICGYKGMVHWDTSKPGGQARRQLDTGYAAVQLGWRATTSLEEGLKRTVEWWKTHVRCDV